MQASESDRNTLLLFLIVLTVELSLVTTTAHAQTPRLQGQGASAAGMGNAFVAQADDPSALHYNPAGMTQLHGFQNLFGTSLVGGTTQFTSPTGTQVTGDRNGAWRGHLPAISTSSRISKTSGSPPSETSRPAWAYQSIRLAHPLPERRTISNRRDFTTLPLLDIKPTLRTS